MARLINFQTNQIEEVSDANVQEAFLSGQFGFEKGVPIPVLNQNGDAGEIDPEEAARAFKSGFTFQGAAARAASEREVEFSDRPLEAGTAGFARGLTLGLSDFVLTKTGLVSRERLKALEEENLPASISGEILGSVGPLLIPEPASTAAAAVRLPFLAARLAGAAPRAIAKAGKAVEAGLAAKTGSTVLSNIAAGGVEGALFSASQVVSEQALGDPDLIAEQTLADKGLRVLQLAGQGALFGGALPAGIAATRLAGGIVAPVTKAVRGKISKAINVENIKAFGERQAAKALGAGSKHTGIMMQKVGGVEQMGRDALEVGIKTVKDLDKLNPVLTAMFGRLKRGYQALDTAATAANKMPQAASFKAFMEKEVLDPMLKAPTKANFHRRLTQDLKKRLKLLDDPARNRPNTEITFDELWTWKKEFGDSLNWGDQAAKAYNNAGREYWHAMRTFILGEAEKVGGKRFVAEFVEHNRKFSSLLLAKDIATSVARKENVNRSFGLTDHLSAVMIGNVSGSFLMGLAAGAVNRFVIRDRGNQILATTANKISKLSILQKSAQATDEKADKLISAMLKKDPARPAALATGAVVLDALDLSPNGETVTGTRAEKANQKIKQMTDLASDPQAVAERVSEALGPISESAPAISAALTDKAGQTLNFLVDKAPKRFGADQLFGNTFMASGTQIERWERYLRSANDPLSALEDISRGRLTPEAVETLQVLYPGLYESLKRKIIEKVAENPQGVDRVTRIQLSLLFGQPLDPTVSPSFLSAVQGRYAQNTADEEPGTSGGPGAEQQKSDRISQRAMENNESAERTQTETQRIANGG